VGFHGPRVGGWLVALNGCHRGEDLRLPIGETKLGSSWLSDLVLTGIGVGSQHAKIRMGLGEAWIIPVAEDKSVKINNIVVKSEHKLEDGCLLSVGEVHLVFRLSDCQTPGYRVSEAPRPTNMPNQASHRETVCGWLVISNGAAMGQDYRLVNGRCRIGSEVGLEVTIADHNLASVAASLQVSGSDCKITNIHTKTNFLVNGSRAEVNSSLRESDRVQIGPIEGYIKWFRY
jgi:hypothetical protein